MMRIRQAEGQAQTKAAISQSPIPAAKPEGHKDTGHTAGVQPWCRFSYGIRREARPTSEETRSTTQAGIAVGSVESVESAVFGT
jgi:hypothetical protein